MIWENYKAWKWACEGFFPPCETPNFALGREKGFLKHPSLTSIQAFPIWRKVLFKEELRSTKPAWFIWRSKRECCLWDKDGSALKGFSFVRGCPPTAWDTCSRETHTRRKAPPLPAPGELNLQFLDVSIKERLHAWPSPAPACLRAGQHNRDGPPSCDRELTQWCNF